MKKHLLTFLAVACTTTAMAQQYIGTYLNTGTGSGPTGITRDAEGNLYVMLRDQQKVVKIDPQMNVTDYCTSGLPPYAMGLTFDTQGNLYVAGYGSTSVLQIPPGGGPAVPYATGISDPMDVKQYDGDTLVVRGSAAVYKIFPGGGVAGSDTVPALFSVAGGIYGGLFVYANKDLGVIYNGLLRYEKSTWSWTNVALMPTSSGYPVLLSNRFGNDQFYLPMGLRMYQVDANTGASVQVSPEGEIYEFYGAYADSEGNFWSTEFGSHRITTYLGDCTHAITLTAAECGEYAFNGIIYTESGSYPHTFTNVYGCDSTVTLELTINPLPEVEVSASLLTICEGQSTQLTATGASVFQWDNALGSGDEHTVSPSQTTTYTAYGIGGNGCQSSAAVTIAVTPLPTIDVAASPSEICLGELVDLSASGAVDIEWDNGLGTGADHTLNPQQTTTFAVTGTTNGCQSTASVTVTVNPIPEVTAQSDNLIICEGESTVLEASGSTVEDWLWMGGISTEAEVTVSPSETTTYTVFGTDANGCVGYDEITVEVNTCVGLGDEPATEEMRVWADGAQNTVYYTNIPTPSVLMVTDMMGRVVCSEQVTASSGQVALQVPVGTYLLQVADGSTSTFRRVVFGR